MVNPIDLKYPKLGKELQQTFENSTGLQIENITITENPYIPVNTQTGESSKDGFIIYKVEIRVPIKIN